MSSLLVYGGDNLNSITGHLKNIGFDEVMHISGRKVKMVKKEIPDNVDLILILTDYINHNLVKSIKGRAAKRDVPIVYSKRSWCAIYKALTACNDACEQCPFLKYQENVV